MLPKLMKRCRNHNTSCKQVEVWLKPTSTTPSFLMPFTNAKFDVDVSASMTNGGAVEMGLTQVAVAVNHRFPM